MAVTLLKLRIGLLVAVIFASLSMNRIASGRIAESARQKALILLPPPPAVESTLMVGAAREIFQKVNLERRRKRLRTLIWNEKLSKLAFDYSEQMGEEDFFSHFDPEGHSLVDRVKVRKIKDWLLLGENLFFSKGNADLADTAVRGWIRSETHRLIMYDPEWTHTGIGVYTTKDRKTYVTQVFMKK